LFCCCVGSSVLVGAVLLLLPVLCASASLASKTVAKRNKPVFTNTFFMNTLFNIIDQGRCWCCSSIRSPDPDVIYSNEFSGFYVLIDRSSYSSLEGISCNRYRNDITFVGINCKCEAYNLIRKFEGEVLDTGTYTTLCSERAG